MMKKQLIIVAGGTGARMGGNIPKQLLELNEKPILMRTIEQFRLFDKNIKTMVVIPKDLFEAWKELCTKHHFTIPHTLIAGGFSRFHSVKNALAECEDEGIIIVHDGVRPFVSQELIQRCVEIAEQGNAVVPVIEPIDSLRQIKDDKNFSVARTDYRNVQTPQIFDAKLLHEAYKAPYMPSFTDDASVMEHAGHHITLVEGSRINIKITTPEDLQIAEALLPIFLS